MERSRNRWIALLAGMAIMVALPVAAPETAVALEDEVQDRPERLIEMAVQYPGVEIGPEEDVDMDVIFHNKGRSDENVQVWVEQQPEGWRARIKTYRYTVTGVHVPGGEDKTLTFEAEPDDGVAPGTYRFVLKARTTDGRFEMEQPLVLEVKAEEAGAKEDKGVKITTSYPVLRGPSDAKFEFSLEVESQLDEEAVFDLFAQGPEGWDVNFKPAYETKYISSLRLKANQSQTVAVEVDPAATAQAQEYPINVRVASGDAKGEAQLNVVLTGTYELEVGTASGLLSLDARQGKPANMSFYVKNTGSATQKEIGFMSFKPENWKTEFKPEKLAALAPGDLKQVEVVMTPYEDALVGDYAVNVKVEGEKASEDLEFRVTVKASSVWGWIGIGIIIVVIGGLTVLFRWLGRR